MDHTFNVYCDESCHLENDGEPIMVLGAVWCPLRKTREIATRLREIKTKHGLKPDFEIKWTKVSPSKTQFYLDLIDYFFDDDHLHFRALVVRDKTALNHERFDQTHDLWYFKMYFQLLRVIIDPEFTFHIYLDIKDTRSQRRVKNLHEVLSNSFYDFSMSIVPRIQTVRSHEVEQMQLVDLLTGAICYRNRQLSGNAGKETLIKRIQERSKYDLTRSTLPRESKVNIFQWTPSQFGTSSS